MIKFNGLDKDNLITLLFFGGLVVWQHFIGYAFIAGTIFVVVYAFFTTGKEPGDGGLATVIALMAIPLALLLLGDIVLNHYEIGQAIELYAWIILFALMFFNTLREAFLGSKEGQ